MVMNISCKFEKGSYNIFFFLRALMVKSLYTLRRHNKAKSIVSTGCYTVDTNIILSQSKTFTHTHKSPIYIHMYVINNVCKYILTSVYQKHPPPPPPPPPSTKKQKKKQTTSICKSAYRNITVVHIVCRVHSISNHIHSANTVN